MISDKQEKELDEIMRERRSVVKRCEELGGCFSSRYLSELNRITEKSEDFHRRIQKPEKVLSEIPYDYSQEKVFRDLSLKRLSKNGIHP